MVWSRSCRSCSRSRCDRYPPYLRRTLSVRIYTPPSNYLSNLPCSASNPETRKQYVELVEAVQGKGGEVVIFSSMHESGQRKLLLLHVDDLSDQYTELNQLTGIAAILTFPLDVEVVEAEEKEAAEEEQRRKEEAALKPER